MRHTFTYMCMWQVLTTAAITKYMLIPVVPMLWIYCKVTVLYLESSRELQVCCSVLQCVVVRCSVLQCVEVCCSVLQCVAVCCNVLLCEAVRCNVLQCVAVRCNVLQWWSTARSRCCTSSRVVGCRCIAVCCSVLQCVAVCCNV